ncbi:MAG TPA: conjugal transfer protein TraS [Albitalea sp.]|uniref:relaxase/mobilization nuclease domain-containing protein n=1 Tax=Piscinibacter sp. TaxID=1903157 RepID=UPI002ED3279A
MRTLSTRRRAAVIRKRIAATIVRRTPQVMVKVTGGGRGIKAIAAHFRYIAKNGRLDIEDDRGVVSRGKESLRELVDEWRFGGSLIPDESSRREAFNIILSMPRGTDPLIVQRAAREFAQAEFADHKYVMVLHDHQANPHVHLSVRAESKQGRRLNPRKADLHRWREVFAEKLRGWGIDAEATRQPTRGTSRSYSALWQIKAAADGRLSRPRPQRPLGAAASHTRDEALSAWSHIGQALSRSNEPNDRALADSIARFVRQAGIEHGTREQGASRPVTANAEGRSPNRAGVDWGGRSGGGAV